MASVLYYEPLALMGSGPIAGVCRRFGLEVVPVPRSRTGRSVGFLAGLPGYPEGPEGPEGGTPPEERTLVFCGVDRDTLDAVLEALKAAGAPPALKAVLTGANAAWSFARLVRELSAERRAMGGT